MIELCQPHTPITTVPAGDVTRAPPSVQGPLPRAVSSVGTASAAGPCVREVANVGLESSVLGERALQPCDPECFTEITFLGSASEVGKIPAGVCTALSLQGS